MKLSTECLECYLRKNIATARSLGTEEQAMAFSKDLMRSVLDAPDWVSAPYFAPSTAQLFARHYGVSEDQYTEEKAASNRFILERMDAVRQSIQAAPDPIYAGLQCAILGNYIDFSALAGEVDFGVLDGLLEKSRQFHVDEANYRQLVSDCRTAKELLYLTDNAGEIGFDRLFAEELHKAFPQMTITFCVRGGPTINDATRADAAEVGLPFPVIDNGTRYSGTVLPLVSKELKDALNRADVVIAKGQANVETMLPCGKNVYYAFLVKCQRFINAFQKPKLTPMLLRDAQGPDLGFTEIPTQS